MQKQWNDSSQGQLGDKIKYEQEFEEIKCVGRGNFGAAFLVKFKNSPPGDEQFFIAKKIILGQLSEHEEKGAHLEAVLLRQLHHPNIVSYKHSFIENGMLIIIMEFCEHGDVAYHIRKKKAKNERFSETEIMNWFVQLCLALEYIHSHKILHRDLKTQNIFLTKYNTVKLGDFGISKVLDSTTAVAMTVQGTPYYMSPEVCQSMPYSYLSDIWALGVILYEMCTLKHPFSSTNVLTLAVEIVQNDYEQINDEYSKELKALIASLLQKDQKNRPQIIEIINRPFVKQHMERFVKSAGKINLNPTLTKKKDIAPTMALKDQKLKQQDHTTLSAKEQQRMKREQKYQEEFELMRKAALENQQNQNVAKQMKIQQFYQNQNIITQKSGLSQMEAAALIQKAGGHSLPSDSFHVQARSGQNFAPQDQFFQEGMQRHPQTQYDGFKGHAFEDNKQYLKKPQYVDFGQNAYERSGASDQFQVNDRSGHSDQFQVNDRSGASDQFQVNDRSGASDQFQVNDRSGGSETFEVNDRSRTANNFRINDLSSGSDGFQVNDRSGASSQFQVNERSAGSEDFQVNDRSGGSTAFELSHSINQLDVQVGINPHFNQKRHLIPPGVTGSSMNAGSRATVDFMISQSAGDFQTNKQIQGYPYPGQQQYQMGSNSGSQLAAGFGRMIIDDRPLTGTGAYKYQQQLHELEDQQDDVYSDEFYSEDFEEPDQDILPTGTHHNYVYDQNGPENYQQQSSASTNHSDLAQVVGVYAKFLDNKDDFYVDSNADEFQQYNFTESFKVHPHVEERMLRPKPSQALIKPAYQRHQESKDMIQAKMGSELFSTIYEMLELEIQQETNPNERAFHIRDVCNGDKDLIRLCQKLEEIIYLEQTFQYA